jgi:hypothetical protein
LFPIMLWPALLTPDEHSYTRINWGLMRRGRMTFYVLLLCGMLAPAAFCQTAVPAPPSAAATASQLLDMRMSADPKVRAAASKRQFSEQIAADLANPDPNVQSSAIAVLNKLLKEDLRDPGGKAIVPKKTEWCGRVLNQKALVNSLMKLNQGDVIEQLAAGAIADGSDLPAGDRGQAALVRLYLATGKPEQALPAAKTYFNYCLLENTPKATQLIAEALANGKDKTLLDRFVQQQSAAAAPATQPTDLGENVLKSIQVDPYPYQAKIADLAAGPQDFDTLTARGNLLLLSDKGAEAKEVFDKALSLAFDQKHVSTGVANVARALRARDGNVAAANAYLLSLRTQASAGQEPK